jgi:NAD(P)H-flavin reductase
MSPKIPEPAPVRSAPRTLPTGPNPYLPVPARFMKIAELTPEVRLFDLRFTDDSLAEAFSFRPGQFVELSVLGVGEAPFSLPSSPTRSGSFQLAIRRAGTLTDYLFDRLGEGSTVGIRGPLGNGFPVERFEGSDLLLVAGGLGMVPLRGLLRYLVDLRRDFGRVVLLYGTREPGAVLFRDELESLARRGDAEIHLAVEETGGEPWSGAQGYVTDLLERVDLDPASSFAVACGPPVFYKFLLERLVEAGYARDRILMSLERRMECGVGKCGHCAVGYTFTCLHGPVFTYWDVLNLPELIDT